MIHNNVSLFRFFSIFIVAAVNADDDKLNDNAPDGITVHKSIVIHIKQK